MNVNIDPVVLQKMAFIYNAIEDGWSIKKKGECYVFSKTHEGKKEIYLDSYLKQFVSEKMNIRHLINASTD